MTAMKLRPETLRHVHNIMDTFAGADGGGKFMDFRLMIEDIDAQAASEIESAQKILDIVIHFSRLLDIATDFERSRWIQ